jgi:hypothetical protein
MLPKRRTERAGSLRRTWNHNLAAKAVLPRMLPSLNGVCPGLQTHKLSTIARVVAETFASQGQNVIPVQRYLADTLFDGVLTSSTPRAAASALVQRSQDELSS